MPLASESPFTTAERALIRHEFLPRFGQCPLLANGIWLRTWKSGPLKGQPKLPPAVASLLERGLVEVPTGTRHGARALFTTAGFATLRQLARDRRALNPREYGHLHRELGLEAEEPAAADESYPQNGG